MHRYKNIERNFLRGIVSNQKKVGPNSPFLVSDSSTFIALNENSPKFEFEDVIKLDSFKDVKPTKVSKVQESKKDVVVVNLFDNMIDLNSGKAPLVKTKRAVSVIRVN